MEIPMLAAIYGGVPVANAALGRASKLSVR